MFCTTKFIQQLNKHSYQPRKLLAILLALTAQHSVAAILPGELLITELMANPAAVSDSKGEWFEVLNTSNHSVDLNGLTVKDNGSNSFTVSESLIVNAGEYFVFGKHENINENGGYNADYGYSSFTLANSSDAIILEFNSTIIDSLVYSDPSLFAAAGNSAEWIEGSFQLTPESFSYGDGDIGTPGAAGSASAAAVSPVPLPSAAWFFASALGGLVLRRKAQSKH